MARPAGVALLSAHALQRPQPGPWMKQAACAGVDPDVFFPSHGDHAPEAKEVCARCPVREECLEHALANHERYGVWGGLSEGERRVLQRRDPRPRLSPTVCGTARGYWKHRHQGEEPCATCRAAHAATVVPFGAFPE